MRSSHIDLATVQVSQLCEWIPSILTSGGLEDEIEVFDFSALVNLVLYKSFWGGWFILCGRQHLVNNLKWIRNRLVGHAPNTDLKVDQSWSQNCWHLGGVQSEPGSLCFSIPFREGWRRSSSSHNREIPAAAQAQQQPQRAAEHSSSRAEQRRAKQSRAAKSVCEVFISTTYSFKCSGPASNMFAWAADIQQLLTFLGIFGDRTNNPCCYPPMVWKCMVCNMPLQRGFPSKPMMGGLL